MPSKLVIFLQIRLLHDELRTIFEIKSDVKIDVLSERYLDSKQNQLLEFEPSLIDKLEELIKKLTHSILDLNSLNEKLNNPNIDINSSILKQEINSYSNMFLNIKTILMNLVDSHKGVDLINSKTYKFFMLMNDYSCKDKLLDFFEIFNKIIINSGQMCEIINHDLDEQSKTPQETEGKSFRLLNIIDLDLLYNAKNILSKRLHDKYVLCRNLETSQSPTSLAMIANKFGLKSNSRIFIAEVVTEDLNSMDLNVKESELPFILVQNIHVVNARYEMMSKSFQSTSSKSINKLKTLKLVPILNENKKSEDTYKLVPLIDHETNSLLCILCIKFWQNNQSSLSSTMTSASSSQLSHRDSIDGISPSTINIPIYNSIYFCVYNSTQNLIKNINDILC